MNDLNFDQRAFPSVLDDAFALIKHQHVMPIFRATHMTTEADFEKNIVYSAQDYPDQFVVRAEPGKEKHVTEFIESGPGFGFLRLFLHQKIEGFNFFPIRKWISEKDIFAMKNIAEYCPKNEDEFVAVQHSTASTAVQQRNTRLFTPEMSEELIEKIKKQGIEQQAFGPTFAMKPETLQLLEAALK